MQNTESWKQLNRDGYRCSVNRVARLRRKADIYAKRRRRFVLTTQSKQGAWFAPNLLYRDFVAQQANRVWVGDVTQIATRKGWLYVAVLIDLYSRKVVGWSMSRRNNAQLVQDCLSMAVAKRRPAKKLIHHTDRGIIYTSQEYCKQLKKHAMVSSMSRKGDCWDNAVAESFFSNLKNELVHWHRFESIDQAKARVFDYIEVFYNRQRLHQTLNYESPVQYENMEKVA